jgi:predicted regulator of Ras-like GTPase activity (Roadblock/LC7/MglB family)
MSRNDELLRQARLTYYAVHLDQLDQVLTEFLRQSKARCALLVDKEGHLITSQGDAGALDVNSISALVAASFAATREMARLLGEDEFSLLFHRGKKDHIQLLLIGDRTLMVVIFDESTKVGMVQLYGNEAAVRLNKVLTAREQDIAASIANREVSAASGVNTEDPAYKAEAQQTLDNLFGDE